MTLIAGLLASACGSGPSATNLTPNAAVTPTASASASSTPSVTPSSAATPTATPTNRPSPSPTSAPGIRLVIEDYVQVEVRLARMDAVDTARVKGQFDGIVAGRVMVVDGTALKSLGADGSVRTLGRLAAAPMWTGPGTVAVKPDLSQWLYTVTDTSLTSFIHLGTPTTDRIVATVKSPDGYSFYAAYAWNASGVYMLFQPTGLGGAGPFLDYHFPLVRIDLSTAKLTQVTPTCVALAVLDDGTMVCRALSGGKVEIRSASGQSRLIQVTTGTGTGTDSAFIFLSLAADGKRLILARNGAKDPTIDYQMAVAALTASSATAFGALDFVPNTWLPDGRVVATHQCTPPEWGGGPCSAALDGTYVFSADGRSRSMFYKLTNSAVVGYV